MDLYTLHQNIEGALNHDVIKMLSPTSVHNPRHKIYAASPMSCDVLGLLVLNLVIRLFHSHDIRLFFFR